MNNVSCVVGLTLLFSSLYMSVLKQDKQIFYDFNSLLDDDQKTVYKKIIQERTTAYFTGVILGCTLAILYTVYTPKKDNKNPLCMFLAIAYLTKLFVYRFWPKSPLMLYSLKTKDQTDAWARIYEEMKRRYQMSLFVGFLSYLVLFYGTKM